MTRRRALSLGLILAILTAALPGTVSTGAAFSDTTSSQLTASAAMFAYPAILDDADWWLDAADPDTLFSDTACAVPAGTTPSSSVNCWADRNVAGRAVTATTGPASVASARIGPHRPLRFVDGSLLQGPDIFGGSLTDANIFIVLRENRASNHFIFNLNGLSFAARFSLHAPWGNRRWYLDTGGCCTTNRSVSPPRITAVRDISLFTGWKDSAVGRSGFNVNGGTDYLSSGSTAAATNLGLAVGDVSGVRNHDIAEFIVFGERLSLADEAAVVAYLEDKWGL